MARNRGTAEGLFSVEIDGIEDFRALTVSGGVETTESIGIPDGGGSNREHKVRGNTTVDDLTMEVAAGLYETSLNQLRQDRRDARDGVGVTRRNVRVIQFDETGREPLHTIEYLDCWVKSISPTDRNARGDGSARVTIVMAVESVED